jgi:protein-disulfide isomerase
MPGPRAADAPSSLTSPHAVPRRLYALAALALAGTGVSIYLTQHYYDVRNGSAGFQSFCNLGSSMNCDAVAASSYAELLPGMPLSSFAAGWFIALFIVTLIARNAFWRREAVRALLLLSGVGAVFSLVYFVIMASVLRTYCLFCLVTDAIALLAFGLVLSLKPEGLARNKPEAAKWKTFATVTGVSVIVSLLGLKILDRSQIKGADIRDSIQQVLSSPVLPVNTSAEFPSIGPADAPVTIVEFSDFQCPYCRLGAYSLNTVLKKYPTQVRVVFRSFPLDQACNRKIERMMHVHACDAAKAAHCAHKQGKFVPVYEKLFENQETLTASPPGIVSKLSLEAGIDGGQFNACMAAPETGAAVSRDIEEGINLGIQSTPTFFINGHRVEGGKPPLIWAAIIDEILKTTAAAKR